ncbi:hypothetical protein [Bacillus cereus]|nr:hypothetical protein [Bacillus cereus]
MNIRWDVYNMLTIWLMVGILYVAIGLTKSLVSGATGSGAQ